MSLRPAIPLHQYRGHVLIAAPATEPVTLQEIRAQLAIDGTDDDELLTDMIVEARQEIEDASGMALVTQSWRLSLDRWPNGIEEWWTGTRQGAIGNIVSRPAWVELPRSPLASIVAVSVFDDLGAETVVDVASVFDVDTYQTPGRMALKVGKTWPIALREINAIQIDYTAGYGAAADVPAPIKRAIKAMVGYLYSHRGDDCSAGDAMAESGAGMIVGRYKVKRV